MPLPELIAMTRITNPSCAAAYGPGAVLEKSSFAPAVRAFHLNRLPRFNTAFSGSICAYCGRETGRRSMQIDHIIPMRIYIRFKMINDPTVGTATSTGNAVALNRIADAFFADRANLLLACQRCNSIKKEAMPDTIAPGTAFTWLQLAQRNLPNAAMQGFATDRAADCARIRGLSAARNHFVFNGSSSNTSIMNTRKRTRDTTPPTWIGIQRTVIGRYSTSRPRHGYDNSDLESTQAPGAAGPARNLRVCLYCLGLFMDQAFQLDHIRPVNRSRTSASVAKAAYNNPANIVAVCGSCNGSKSNSGITRGWLASRASARTTEGLPGLDTALSGPDYTRAKAKRDDFLGV